MVVVSVIIYRKNNAGYEFLLLKRVPKFGDFWQPPGGRMEEGETKLETAYREVLEEAGITKDDILKIHEDIYYFTVLRHYLSDKPLNSVSEQHVMAFEVRPDTKINIHNNPDSEHEEYKWVDYDTVVKMLKWQNNKDSYEKLKVILKIS